MGSKPDNSAAKKANQQAKQAAAEARQKEIDRQNRLDTGYNAIKNTFDGTPIYGDPTQATYDWSTFQGPAVAGKSAELSTVPNGYTVVQLPGKNGGYGLQGPDGKIYKQGDALTYMKPTVTGHTGGFGDEFYNQIGTDVTNLGNVDINDQYNKARENLQYALARSGLSASSAGNQGVADVESAKTKAGTDLAQQAAAATGKVRDSVDQERAASISQLYATEDPSLAADSATSRFQTIQANKPSYDSLGDIFGKVLSGFGGIYSAGRNAGYFGSNSSPSANSASGGSY